MKVYVDSIEEMVEIIAGLTRQGIAFEAHFKQQWVITITTITAAGAGGLMLRKPGSAYEPKRTFSLLKYKPFLDGEATVIGHVEGRGKHVGRLGALVCLMGDGTKFQVGFGFIDTQRENLPAINSTIIFNIRG